MKNEFELLKYYTLLQPFAISNIHETQPFTDRERAFKIGRFWNVKITAALLYPDLNIYKSLVEELFKADLAYGDYCPWCRTTIHYSEIDPEFLRHFSFCPYTLLYQYLSSKEISIQEIYCSIKF